MDRKTMLQVERATLRLGGIELLAGFDMQVAAGEMVCLTGESGCGKTSLLRAVLGFVPLDGGQIQVDGLKLSAATADDIRRRVAYVPQELSLPCERVSEMVRLPFELKANRGAAFSHERLLDTWRLLGLEPDLLHRKTNKISGGQRQRILLSTSVLLGKKLLLADEPTSALDAESVQRVSELLHRTCSAGTAVVVVSHDTRLISACHRVVCLSDKFSLP